MSKAEKGSSKGKRRRRSGLRVPSDNVPRPNRDSDPATPAPEDPRLAVSVAYAFKSGNNETVNADDAEAEPDVRDTLRERRPPTDMEEAIGDDAEQEESEGEREETFDDRVTSPLEVPEEASDAAPAKAAAGGDSVDIAFDEDETLQANSAGEAEPVAATGKAKSGKRPKKPRMQTVALSDDELEEMMLSADPSVEFDSRKTVKIPAVRFKTDKAGRIKTIMPRSRTGEEEAVDPEDLPPPVAPEGMDTVVDTGDIADLADDDQDDDSGTDPVAALPLEPASAEDSGEMIADEMLEEIDETGLAEPAVADADEADDDDDDDEQKTIELGEGDAEPADIAREGEKPPPAPTAKPKPPPAPDKEAAKPAAPAPKKPRRAKPWFEEVFDENYLRTLPFLTPQATEKEANFVIDALSVEKGGQILDVGCGYGRHAMELAARGYHMAGIDVSLPLLMRGADEAQRRGLTINFVHGDMREMTFENQFDGAYCLFSSFGYFDDDANRKTAKNIARALKPGARFVIEVLNRDYLVGDLPNRVWWEGDGCVVLEEVDFNYFSSRIVSTRSVAFDDGRQIEQEISLRAYSLHEMGRLLHAAGFRVVEVSGSMPTRGRFFGAHSRDIIVVAEKYKKNPEA